MSDEDKTPCEIPQIGNSSDVLQRDSIAKLLAIAEKLGDSERWCVSLAKQLCERGRIDNWDDVRGRIADEVDRRVGDLQRFAAVVR